MQNNVSNAFCGRDTKVIDIFGLMVNRGICVQSPALSSSRREATW